VRVRARAKLFSGRIRDQNSTRPEGARDIHNPPTVTLLKKFFARITKAA